MKSNFILQKEKMDFFHSFYIYIFLFFIFMLNMIFSTEEVLVSIGLFLFLNTVFLNLRSFFIKYIEDNNKTFYDELFTPIKDVNDNADKVLSYYNLEFKAWNSCYSILKIKIADELNNFNSVQNSVIKGELVLMYKLKKSMVSLVKNYYYVFYFNFMKYNFNVHLYRSFDSWTDSLDSLKLFVNNYVWILAISSFVYGESKTNDLNKVIPVQSHIDSLSWVMTSTMLNSFLKDIKN